MKLNRLEAHDRLKHFLADQSESIYQGAEDCLKRNPLSLAIQEKCPYLYIFAHPRTADDGVTKVMYWQPRLSIPSAQTNSYLFRAVSKTDIVEVIWMIPPREHWEQYKKGNITESNWCRWSIEMFQKDDSRKQLEKPHPEDLSESICQLIMKNIINEHREQLEENKRFKAVYHLQKEETNEII
jgi:hypothetical protein